MWVVIGDPPRCTSRMASDRKSTRLNSSHSQISYAVFCLKKKKTIYRTHPQILQLKTTSTQAMSQEPRTTSNNYLSPTNDALTSTHARTLNGPCRAYCHRR